MKTFFQDEFLNTKVMTRLVKEVKRAQLNSAIDELGSLNRMQSNVVSRSDLSSAQKEDLEFIKKVHNAASRNIQI